MKRLALIGLVLTLAASAATPALAQDPAEDWDLTVDPARELTVASLDFGGNALALRCQNGMLDLLLTGTPTTAGPYRIVRVTGGGIVEETQWWLTQPGLPVLAAPEPDRMARLLRAGGDLDLRIEAAAEGERPLRFRLSMPPSAGSLDRVLSACGAGLSEEWDLRPRPVSVDFAWAYQALPEYPESAVREGAPNGAVRIACILPADGRFRECRIMRETPAGLGFGANALESALRSSITRLEPGSSSTGGVVHFTVRFRLDGAPSER